LKILERIGPLCNFFNGLTRESSDRTQVFVGTRPGLKSQLTSENISLWSKVTTELYSGVSHQVDLTFQLGDEVDPEPPSETLDIDTLPKETSVPSGVPPSTRPTDTLFKEVVLGGTFDRIHAGHKILLSEAILRCTKRLTVGVTSPALLQNKTLPELILPTEERIRDVEKFVREVDGKLEQNLVAISDPFGPAIVVPQLECIVGSKETDSGCAAINRRRGEAGLKELQVHLIDLVQEEEKRGGLFEAQEDKVSSSTARIRLLGQRLRPPLRDYLHETGPYIIGLTGGSASGKTSVGARLEGEGFGVINCDKLGHAAYVPGTRAHARIVENFGPEVVGDDGTIIRKELGKIVFGDKSKLKLLNNIVWPEIRQMAQEQSMKMWENGTKIVVWDAAVLLEAKWEEYCHEVWCCVVPKAEAVRRITERDKLEVSAAEARIGNQLSNSERVSKASTVFSTLWEESFTQKQVENAANRIKMELNM